MKKQESRKKIRKTVQAGGTASQLWLASRRNAQKFSTLLIKIVQLAHSLSCTIKKLLKTIVQNAQMALYVIHKNI